MAAELDGRPIAITGSKDQTLRVWDLDGMKQYDEWQLPGPVEDLALGQNGTLMAVIDGDIAAFATNVKAVPSSLPSLGPHLNQRSQRGERSQHWWKRILNR